MTRKYTPNTFYHLYDYKLTHTPFRAMFEFLRIVKMVEPYYSQIKTPVCLVQGEKDEIVPFSSAEHLYKTLGSEKKYSLNRPWENIIFVIAMTVMIGFRKYLISCELIVKNTT